MFEKSERFLCTMVGLRAVSKAVCNERCRLGSLTEKRKNVFFRNDVSMPLKTWVYILPVGNGLHKPGRNLFIL